MPMTPVPKLSPYSPTFSTIKPSTTVLTSHSKTFSLFQFWDPATSLTLSPNSSFSMQLFTSLPAFYPHLLPSLLFCSSFLVFVYLFLQEWLQSKCKRLPPGSMGWPYLGETSKLYNEHPNTFFSNRQKRCIYSSYRI